MDELLQERYDLSLERIREIEKQVEVQEPFGSYFRQGARFLAEMDALRQWVADGGPQKDTVNALRERNLRLYGGILPENYGSCYGNPEYAVKCFGREYGQILSFLYAEMRGMIIFAYEQKVWDMEIIMELFLEIYHMFADAPLVEPRYLKESIYWYVSDYVEEFTEQSVLGQIDPKNCFAREIIMEADLSDLRYLYRYGEYVTENEERTAEFLNRMSQEEIDDMARTFTEGYRIGFVLGHKPLEKKKTVNIRYTLGFERLVRAEILQFAEMGLKPTIYRSAVHMCQKSRRGRIGYYGAAPNPQFEYDHRNDGALYLDQDYIQRKLRALQSVYEEHRELAAAHGGPACMEIFGEKPFEPVSCKDSLVYTPAQQKLQVQYDSESGQIVNRYIIGEERSFTIIAYPVPEIGAEFEAIFRETVKINTLDYQKYQRIQQYIIDALDRGISAHVKGRGANQTDLTVRFHQLEDPRRQSNFENCVADVNIPVGEVFTSPLLAGTSGLLHVSNVYLGELYYVDLKLWVRDGMVEDYSCANFGDEAENRRYVEENILFQHPTVPMGEFAIGTNTTAYVMAQRYQIADKLPILIAEKMGPHFAFGDTCYSWQEDTAVYNPDGKEIIARDNEISLLRKEDVGRAYFGCHTDITIPYDELDWIRVEMPDGSQISIIENGRFVLPGTEELNDPFEG